MRAYLLCVAKDRSELPSADRLDRAAAATLPFRTSGADASWSPEGGRTGLWMWHNEAPDGTGLLNHHDDGVDGWSGYFIGQPDPSDPSRSGGVWAHFRASSRTSVVTTCASGTEQVFYAETPAHIVVGSRAQLVGLVAYEDRLDVDVAGLAAVLNAGFCTTDRTIFRGVKALPPGWRILASAEEGLRLEPMPYPDALGDPPRAVDALIASVSEFPATAGTIRLGLTGGRDSRLLAGVLVKAGVPVTAYTSGTESDPDVVIARRVAQALGIDHRLSGPRGVTATAEQLEVDPRTRVRQAVALGEGMLGAYDRVGRIDERFDPQLIPFSGSGGEILRGYYANALHDVDSPDVARRVLLKRALPQEKLLSRGAKQEYLADLQGWLDAVAQAPGAALADFYLRQRTARWSGAARGSSSMGSLAWRPFFDHQVVRAVQAVPLALRTSERFFASLLDALAPELADVPFVGKRWAFDQQAPRGATERERWEQRAPLTGTHGEGPSFNWRTDLPEVRAELQAIVESAPDRLWAVADETSVAQLLLRAPTATRAQTLALWNLATVAHTLTSSVELGEGKFDTRPTPIQVRRRTDRRGTDQSRGARRRLTAEARAVAKRAYLRVAAIRAWTSARRAGRSAEPRK